MPSLGSFQDYLSAAVKLKTSLIKAKPGRQEWEQAPPFMRCTAAAIDSVQRARAGSFSVQYSTALQLKDQGNELIHKDPAAALERYTEALSVFLWFDRGPDRAAEDVPLLCAADKLEGAERDQAHHLLAVAFSNAAACLLQMGMAADAAYACGKALKYDPYNVKAFYRRAMAHRQAGSTAGLEAALSDLVAANQLEPANSQVRLALAAVQQELRQHRRQERGMYGNMFQRGVGLYGDSEAAASSAAGRPPPGTAGGGEGPRAAKAAAGLRGARSGAPAAASDDDDDDEEEEDWREGKGPATGGAGDLDPEDLLFLDPKARKAESALASREADLVMRRMQAALARGRNRKMAAALEAERARRPGRLAFPWWAVPWWAYALIGLHLAYRLIKVWRMPAPSSSGGLAQGGMMQDVAGAAAAAAAAAGGAQQGLHLEL